MQANTPIFLLLMGLTSFILPQAAVYNLFVFVSFLVAYVGILSLARLYVEKQWIALLAALLYTFWGMRWAHLGGHVNLLWLSGLLPWLCWALQIYPGPFDESGIANLGIVAVIVALVSLAFVRVKDSRQRFAVLIFIVGMVLALGPFLRWNGQLIKVPFLAPVNRLLWQIGSLLKPEIFPGSIPSDLEFAIPLPAWLLYAAVPYFEGSRVVARFAFIGGIGLLLLVAQIFEKIKNTWLLTLLAILLLLERAPWPVQQGVPLPTATHPAFEWLALQAGGSDKALLDLVPAGDRLTLAISGETLYATDLHNKPTASGVSSMWPESTWFLLYWLQWHQRPLHHPDLPVILDDYGINWVLVHMKEDQARKFVVDPNFTGLKLVACFDPTGTPSAWPYPICVLEVQ